MKIYTLNVNGFKGVSQKNNQPNIEKGLLFNLNNLKNLIDTLIIDEESIIILQEVPHMKLISKRSFLWEKHPIYNHFFSAFSQYKIIKPRHLINSYQCTIALCSNNSQWIQCPNNFFSYDSKYSFGNKLVEIQHKRDKFLLLGIHVNPNDTMWDMIFQSCSNKRPTFIVGDFNSYELRGCMKNKPQKLKKLNYCACIPINVITAPQYQSSIDNIFIDLNFCINGTFSSIVKTTDSFKTDHALCGIEISCLQSHYP